MTKKLNYILVAILTAFGLVLATTALTTTQVLAEEDGDAPAGNSSLNASCEALQDLDPTVICGGEGAEDKVTSVARTAINILSWIIGVASVIVIVIAGFRFIISGGDSSAVQGARNSILYAVIGLVIVVIAQVIVAFVLTRVQTEGGGSTDTTDTTTHKVEYFENVA